MDHIAGRGALFERAYSLNPVCVPARAGMMTGMFGSDCDSFCNSTVWNGGYPTWGTLLQSVGYACYSVGKFDLNDAFDIGFDSEGDNLNGHSRNPDITSLFRSPSCYRMDIRPMIDGASRDGRLEGRVLRDAFDQLDKAVSQENPWALYVGFVRPHPAYTGWKPLYEEYMKKDLPIPEVSQEELDQLHPVYEQLRGFQRLATPVARERIQRARAAYFASVTELDEDVGRIHNHLEQAGLLENTLFIYTSDHGESLGEHGQWMKSHLMDEAIRVPLLISGPGVRAGVRIRDAVSHADLAATLLDYAGALSTPLRGQSLCDLLAQGVHPPPFAFAECHNAGNCTGSFMVQKGAWKYVEFAYYPEGLLYNLDHDPHEKHNRWDDPSCMGVRSEMRALLRTVIDPEACTDKAFQFQAGKLREITRGKSREEIADLLAGRLGQGQARVLAKNLAGIA